MKTNELVNLLATGVQPAPRHAAARRLMLALAVSLPLALALMAVEWGVRPDLTTAIARPMFWVKLLFPAMLAAVAFAALWRLSRPGVGLGRAGLAVIAVLLAVEALGLAVWLAAPAAERPALLWGRSWRTCLWSIGAIGAPVLLGAFGVLRSLAPTRPALAGAAAGLLAGGVGASVYALHCPELTAPFLAAWYVLGIALPVALGALLGPRMLRW